MIRATTLKGKRVAVFGLGRSGNATCRALVDGGADVIAWDDGEAARAETARQGFRIDDLAQLDWSKLDALVLAPGVPLTHPTPHWTVARARSAGVEVIGDIEIFFRERRATAPGSPVVAITGTNGKSTTTALLAHTLAALGQDVAMGGNIGTAVLSLPPPAAGRVHVLEVSSFQIDLAPSIDPTVGVLLNLAPDHIDRHGTMTNYAAVKEALVHGAGWAAVGVDDPWCRAILGRRHGPKSSFSIADNADYVGDGTGLLFGGTPFADVADVATLRGQHNAQNTLAAAAAVKALADMTGLDLWRPAEMEAAFRTYPGLPHRMEEVGRRGRVLFVNDSKATNADSTEKALAAFPGAIYWILGGKPKEGGIRPLAPYFGRIAKAYLIGQATEDFAATLSGAVAFERCGTLDVALARAADDAANAAAPQPVVLLSPACASYDQYRSFEHRGDEFRSLARRLVDSGSG